MAALLNTLLKRKRLWHRKSGSTAGAGSEDNSSKSVVSPSENYMEFHLHNMRYLV